MNPTERCKYAVVLDMALEEFKITTKLNLKPRSDNFNDPIRLLEKYKKLESMLIDKRSKFSPSKRQELNKYRKEIVQIDDNLGEKEFVNDIHCIFKKRIDLINLIKRTSEEILNSGSHSYLNNLVCNIEKEYREYECLLKRAKEEKNGVHKDLTQKLRETQKYFNSIIPQLKKELDILNEQYNKEKEHYEQDIYLHENNLNATILEENRILNNAKEIYKEKGEEVEAKLEWEGLANRKQTDYYEFCKDAENVLNKINHKRSSVLLEKTEIDYANTINQKDKLYNCLMKLREDLNVHMKQEQKDGKQSKN
eukprot:UN28833